MEDGPRVSAARLVWSTRNVAQIMNMTRDEFEEWLRGDSPELPEGAVMEADEVGWMYDLFQSMATVARQAIANDIDASQVHDLNRRIGELFGQETQPLPTLSVSSELDEDGRFRGRSLWMSWRARHIDKDGAFLPLNLIPQIIGGLETLCGRRRRRFAVCSAPKARAPGEVCNKLFLTARPHTKYCSEACRKRASRANNA